jgi:hypothetical protein
MNPDPAALSNLRDIALPSPVPWWPPAPGWWVVAAGLAVFALLLIARAVLWYRANAYRRAAMRELRALMQGERAALGAGVAAVVKRTALAAYPRAAVAGLTGPAWADFLDRNGGFPRSAAASLARAALDPAHPLSPDEAASVVAAAKRWIRRHRRCKAAP